MRVRTLSVISFFRAWGSAVLLTALAASLAETFFLAVPTISLTKGFDFEVGFFEAGFGLTELEAVTFFPTALVAVFLVETLAMGVCFLIVALLFVVLVGVFATFLAVAVLAFGGDFVAGLLLVGEVLDFALTDGFFADLGVGIIDVYCLLGINF